MTIQERTDYKNSDLKEPHYPMTEEGAKGCLCWVDGKLTYFINRQARAHLLWDCWYSYAKSPYGEDPSLTNDYYENLTTLDHHIEYSETTVIPDDEADRREQHYPGGYREYNERLDFYVTKSEFKKAFLAVKRLGHKEKARWIKEVRIFGSLRVVLLHEAKFGEVSYPKSRSVYYFEQPQ